MRGADLWRDTIRRLTWAAVVANVLGGLVLFLLLGFLIPFAPDGVDRQLTLNTIVGAAYMALTLWLGAWWGRRRGAPVERWLKEGGPPTPHVRRLVLRQPLDFALIGALFWTIAAFGFVALNAPTSGWAALAPGGALLMGGETTSAVCYLLAERILRPITTLALAGGSPPSTTGPGVRGRLTVTWSLGTGVPLLGILAIAVTALTVEGEDLELLAAAVAFLAAIGMSVGLFAMSVAARSVAEPVSAVRRAMERIEAGDLDVTVPVDDGSEVGQLEAGFNRMAAGLRDRERLRDLFGRQVGEEVARAALENDGDVQLGGELREVAAVFVDIVGSTSLASQRPPHEVVALLNRFFAIVVEEVEKQGGWVNKFEGDAALCVFGAPTARPDAAGDALCAARSMCRRIERELHPVMAGVGVSAGPAVAGNVGAESRFEYTVIGDPVNEASRLCDLAKRGPARLVASAAVVERARPEERAFWELREPVMLRGRTEPTRLAGVRPLESTPLKGSDPSAGDGRRARPADRHRPPAARTPAQPPR